MTRRWVALLVGAALSVLATPARAEHPLVLVYTARANGALFDYDLRIAVTNNCFRGQVNWITFADNGSGSPTGAETLAAPTLLSGPTSIPPNTFTGMTSSSGGHMGPTFLDSMAISTGGWNPTSLGQTFSWSVRASNLITPANFYWSYLIGASPTANYEHAVQGPCTGPDSDGDAFPDMCDADDDNDCTLDSADCAPRDPTRHPGATEVCNGLDDNCDGAIDEGLGVGGPCTAGVGACARTGTTMCSPTGPTCSATAGTPTPETCNGIDDDCNGVVDNGNPGGGAACTTGLPGVCSAGVRNCRGGALVCESSIAMTPETCNGMDDNCNGMVDEGFMVGAPCTAGVGVCARTGTTVCASGGATSMCNAMPGPAGMELCGDGLDNDCDGMVDEGFTSVGTPCSAGMGACARMGMYACSMDRLSAVCSAMAAMPGMEVCNGLDDDCDGTTDNGGDALCVGNRSGTRCLAAGMASACGCNADADCGGATSGRICDATTHRCVDGCVRAPGRNDCPSGQFCSSTDPSRAGMCTVGCVVDSDCTRAMPTRPHCRTSDGGAAGNMCVACLSDSQCATGNRCDPVRGDCVPRDAGDAGTDGGRDGGGSDAAGGRDTGTDGAGGGDAAGLDAGGDGGGFGGMSGGCGCRTQGGHAGTRGHALAALALAALLGAARRRRRRDRDADR